MTLQELFEHTERDGDCLLWTRGLSAKGYARARYLGRKQMVHRLTYSFAKGPIPTGLEIDHLCRNRACIHPDHLEAVTHAENMRRAGDAMTTCRKAGHDWSDPGSFYTNPKTGRRRCRECSRIRERMSRG